MIKNKAMIINLINIVVAYLIGLDKRNCLMNSVGNEFIPVGTVTKVLFGWGYFQNLVEHLENFQDIVLDQNRTGIDCCL